MNKRIIYIIGAGRSGTTLLDIVLGNNPQVFSAGELNRFPRRGGIPPQLEKDNPKFVFWKGFKEKLFKSYKDTDIDGLNKLVNQFEYHSGISQILMGSDSNPAYRQYRKGKVTEDLIVDSSKYPCRGFHLARLYKENISFVYIKRNPVGVVHSFSKRDLEQPPKGWLMANLYLFSVNMLCLYILKRVARTSKVVAITLEDLSANTVPTLTHISQQLGVDLSNSIRLSKDNLPYEPGFLFDGNRIRLKSEIRMDRGAAAPVKRSSIKDKLTLLLNYLWWKRDFRLSQERNV